MNIPSGLQQAAKVAKPLTEVIIDIFPRNPIASMVNSNMLQIIVFALFIGVACVVAGEKGHRVASFFESFAEVMYSVTYIVMAAASYGVFALIASTAARYGLTLLAPFAKVIAAVYIGCIVHALVVYSLLKFCAAENLRYGTSTAFRRQRLRRS